jgi:Lon protease-like protein
MPDRDLPIFPLSIVLFPEAPQLLHIFEPRYRQMLADCLEADRRFGVSFVQASESSSTPQLGDVGCSAYVKSHHPLPDGRSNILVLGERRYAVRDYLETDRLYLVAAVEFVDDDPEADAELDELAHGVRHAFAGFIDAFGVPMEQPGGRLQLPEDAVQLSFQIAAALDLDPREKQVLLELRSPAERLRRLRRYLKELGKDAARRSDMRSRARRNGKGPPGPLQLVDQ